MTSTAIKRKHTDIESEETPSTNAITATTNSASTDTLEGKKKKKKRRRKSYASKPVTELPTPAAAPEPSLPLPPVPTGCFNVFVGGLPYDVSKAAITAFFQRDGCHVWGVKIAAHKKDDGKFANQGKGFAHVEFENEQQVARTLLRHGENWTDGESTITVKIAEPKGMKKEGDGNSKGATKGKGQDQGGNRHRDAPR